MDALKQQEDELTTETYVRAKLEAAARQPGRGHLAKIARAADCDVRTVRAILTSEHASHVNTLDKLEAYFKKQDRRAKA